MWAINSIKYYMSTLKKNVSFHIKVDSWVQYLRRGLHLQRFDPSGRLVEARIWIYAGLINIGAGIELS